MTVLASIKFDQDVYTVSKPGTVRIVLRGVSGMAVTLAERPQVELATPGPPHRAVLRLPRGTYHLQSVIPAHTRAGIHALLIVG